VETDVTDGVSQTTWVDYVRDSAGGIVKRTVDNPGTTTDEEYWYTGSAVLDGSNVLLQRSISLPGGVTVAYKGTGGSATQQWTYPNIHGDIAVLCGADGARGGDRFRYDPFGQPIAADGTRRPRRPSALASRRGHESAPAHSSSALGRLEQQTV
jgi:large repetitive protein